MDTLSARGRQATRPVTSYIAAWLQAKDDPFVPGASEDGFINFSTAQNLRT